MRSHDRCLSIGCETISACPSIACGPCTRDPPPQRFLPCTYRFGATRHASGQQAIPASAGKESCSPLTGRKPAILASPGSSNVWQERNRKKVQPQPLLVVNRHPPGSPAWRAAQAEKGNGRPVIMFKALFPSGPTVIFPPLSNMPLPRVSRPIKGAATRSDHPPSRPSLGPHAGPPAYLCIAPVFSPSSAAIRGVITKTLPEYCYAAHANVSCVQPEFRYIPKNLGLVFKTCARLLTPDSGESTISL